ncbi:MAG: hypothetical protein QM601_08160 [Pseudoxanthomonas sp.]
MSPPLPAPPQLQPLTPRVRAAVWAVGVLIAAALVFGVCGLWTLLRPAPSAAQYAAAQARLRALEQQVATLTRSDQISREANKALQDTLGERDEEIAGLRTDVDFYERLVGATSQRRALGVHELHLQAEAGQAWHFTATLAQTRNRDALNRGRLSLAVEGTRAGRLQTLEWPALRQQPQAEGLAYSFKYFQRIEGEIVLPAGFTPLRVIARLQPDNDSRIDQVFAWAEAAVSVDADAPQQAAGAG